MGHLKDWFGGTTTYTVVSELDDPTWPCIECLPKVVSDFVGEQSRVHIMPISGKWKHKSSIHIGFIVFNRGLTTFFAKSVFRASAIIWYKLKYIHLFPVQLMEWDLRSYNFAELYLCEYIPHQII